MRIALIVPEFPPETVGGGGVVFAALAEQYRRGGAYVRVYSGAGWSDHTALPTGSSRTAASMAGDVKRYTLLRDPLHRPELRSVMPPRFRSLLSLHHDLKDFQPTVAHVHGFGYVFVDIAASVLRHQGVPYVFTLHGVPASPARMIGPVRLAYSAYARLVASRTCNSAWAVTTVSRAVRLPCAHRQAVWIPNGINPKDIDPQAAERVRVLLGSRPLDGVLIAAAGRLAYSKGFDVLVKACGLLECDRVTVAIAGEDAGQRAALLKCARGLSPRVTLRLLGRLTQSEVSALFAAADVVVVPSRSEPFGLVALEAVAASARLIVADVDGLHETFESSVVRKVAPGLPEALAQGIRDALTAGPLTESERSDYTRLLRAHSWDDIAGRYIQLLRACQLTESQQ